MRRVFLAVLAVVIGCTGSEPTQPVAPSGPLAVGSIRIEGPASMRVADSASLGVVVLDIAGNVVSNRPVSFTSSDPGIASVNSSGVVRALAEGSVAITAKSESVTSQKTVRILARIPCSAEPPECLASSERYVLILVDDQPLPIKSPWGIGEWDYDSDAGTWMLTDAAITLFADGRFTYETLHRAASGATASSIAVGRYERGADYVEFSAEGNKWRATISTNRLIERWSDGRTLTFAR